MLVKLAKTLSVTIGALLFNEDERAPSDDLALQFEAIRQFSEEEKQTVRELLEGLILKHQARRWNTPPRTAARYVKRSATLRQHRRAKTPPLGCAGRWVSFFSG